ncbi:Coatomer subunit gamma [Mycena indigotica]|uniref:Coatomer subunit gamma n=1 Tax=Mycena indigotica TaxID=2126181 RepID=A0A8H6W0G0_9AGAR|nr:Coatomer subunit gamma [Mycena indigotica]KAF7297048.1 Coatomer subunit gamma [Mycena indigotica]
MALSMLIRYAANVMAEDPNQIVELLECWPRHKSDMANFEAGCVLREMKNDAPAQLTQSIAGKTCNFLFNRSVATYDITTTLLQTGHEASVDCLIKQMITSFMSEIRKSLSTRSALFATQSLPSTPLYPISFLVSFATRVAMVLNRVQGVSAVASPRGHWGLRVYKTLYSHPLLARSQGAQSFPTRQIHSFHLLSRCPGNAAVRAAAVSSLAKFGLNFNREALNQSVGVLSRRCLDDVDDEVRDRAAMYLKVFRKQTLAEPHVKDGLSLAALESKHVAYVKDSAASAQAFEVSGTPQDQPCSNHRRRGCPTQLIG